jgi:hypothetical protein
VPNVFKSKIPPFTDLDKPAWVIEEETKNPNALPSQRMEPSRLRPIWFSGVIFVRH